MLERNMMDDGIRRRRDGESTRQTYVRQGWRGQVMLDWSRVVDDRTCNRRCFAAL